MLSFLSTHPVAQERSGHTPEVVTTHSPGIVAYNIFSTRWDALHKVPNYRILCPFFNKIDVPGKWYTRLGECTADTLVRDAKTEAAQTVGQCITLSVEHG